MKNGVVAVLSSVVGTLIGAGVVKEIEKKEIKKEKFLAEKHLALYLMMNQWVKVKQDNKSIAAYLENKGYKNIAIYGMNYVGETLVNELKNTNIVVKYGIDQNAESIYSDIDIVAPNNNLESVDAIIVTPITFFDSIENDLSKKMKCPILSLEDILYEV